MDLSTIAMTRDEARAALAEWAGTADASPEDEAIAAGYRAIARGYRLLTLTDTIRAGGEDDRHLPRLAVAPVESSLVYLERGTEGTVRYCVSDNHDSRTTKDVSPGGVRVRDVLPPIEWADRQANHLAWGHQWKAMVPVVPPRFRRRGWRSSHVLFEAEWTRHTPPAPVDPALIRHLRGDLWMVLGVWDLTPLERAVLLERNRRR